MMCRLLCRKGRGEGDSRMLPNELGKAKVLKEAPDPPQLATNPLPYMLGHV